MFVMVPVSVMMMPVPLFMRMAMFMVLPAHSPVNVSRFHHAHVFYVQPPVPAALLACFVVGWLTTLCCDFVDGSRGRCHYQKRRIFTLNEVLRARSTSANLRR